MKTVFQVFDSANLDRCRFYIGMTSFLVFFFFFIAMILQDSFWLILAGAAILGWLAAMAFWLRKRQNISSRPPGLSQMSGSNRCILFDVPHPFIHCLV